MVACSTCGRTLNWMGHDLHWCPYCGTVIRDGNAFSACAPTMHGKTNARLIDSASQLLAACQAARLELANMTAFLCLKDPVNAEGPEKTIALLDAAIAKAKGEATETKGVPQ